MGSLRSLVLKVLRSNAFRAERHKAFLRGQAKVPSSSTDGNTPIKLLVLGVYIADRLNSVDHMSENLCSSGSIEVEQRWVALKGHPTTARQREITKMTQVGPKPKFLLINELLQLDDYQKFDFIIVCDDDIYLPKGFLQAFLGWQRKFDFAVAQPSRAWHSHFDHAFVLRRPWLKARQTRFVESGPLVSFRKDAVKLLMPFDQAVEMWGMDLTWPKVLEASGLKMGIIDALSVDHSLRGQAVSYSKTEQDLAMHRYLAKTPHLSMEEAFTVLRTFVR